MDDAYLNVVDQYLPTMTVSADPPLSAIVYRSEHAQ